LRILERIGLISSNYERKSLQILKSRNPSVENYITVNNYTLTERARENQLEGSVGEARERMKK